MSKTKKYVTSTLLSLILFLLLFSTSALSAQAAGSITVDKFTSPLHYEDDANWLYDGVGEGKPVDVFIVAPSVDIKSAINSDITPEYKINFRNAMNQQQALFAYTAKIYAPYYRQAALKAYEYDLKTREEILENAYIDVSAAFKYYLEHKNNGRPVILAGFSQGADMCYRLLQEYYSGCDVESGKRRDNLVAVYGIGWTLTEEMLANFQYIKAAQGELDTGVIISYDCEDGNVTDSIITPSGTQAISINPLNWKTDSTVADKSLNKGSVTQDVTGAVTSITAGLYGAYIDPERGTLIVTDIDTRQYPPVLAIFPEGSLHLYDNFLFYANLQENVQKRTDAFLAR